MKSSYRLTYLVTNKEASPILSQKFLKLIHEHWNLFFISLYCFLLNTNHVHTYCLRLMTRNFQRKLYKQIHRFILSIVIILSVGLFIHSFVLSISPCMGFNIRSHTLRAASFMSKMVTPGVIKSSTQSAIMSTLACSQSLFPA